jgi:hypothetical protein
MGLLVSEMLTAFLLGEYGHFNFFTKIMKLKNLEKTQDEGITVGIFLDMVISCWIGRTPMHVPKIHDPGVP